MCGRFALSITPARLQQAFGVAPPEGWTARWNIVPDSPVLVVRARPGAGREAALVRWGMLAPWTKDAKDPGRQINARLETAAEKPMFRDALRRHRCVLPADGFYEWQKTGRAPSRPFFIARRDGAPLALAGLWRASRLDDGSVLETCAVLTTDAWPGIRSIHHRMPVLLAPEAVGLWLDPDLTDATLLRETLVTVPEDALAAVEVGREVNDPRTDHAGLTRPLAAREPSPPPRQGSLL